MAIERLSFDEGMRIELDPIIDVEQIVLNLFDSSARRAMMLAPGEYDLTPSLPFVAHKYSLVVHENGTASYRIIPEQEDAKKVKFSAVTEPVVGGGGEFTSMPDDDTMAIITVPLDEKSFQLYEAIRFLPQE